jgi:hypothetical protein
LSGFPEFRSAYPRRAGGNSWRKAELRANRLVASGEVTWQQLVDGATRYAAFVKATGKEMTEFVQMPSTFLGSGEGWAERWDLPLTGPAILTDAQLREQTIAREGYRIGVARLSGEPLDAWAQRIRAAYINQVTVR